MSDLSDIRGCENCKHDGKDFRVEEPCKSCLDYDDCPGWKPKEATNGEVE